MHQIGDARRSACLSHCLSSGDMHLVERLSSRRIEDGDQVHDGIRSRERLTHRIGIAHVCLDGMDLPDRTHWLQVAGEVRTADGVAHPPAAPGKLSDDIAANEARSTEDGYETAIAGAQCHDAYPVLR